MLILRVNEGWLTCMTTVLSTLSVENQCNQSNVLPYCTGRLLIIHKPSHWRNFFFEFWSMNK